jgi:hypothetical protein
MQNYETQRILSISNNHHGIVTFGGKQEFRLTDFGSRLLAAEGERDSEGEGAEDRCG